MIKLVKNRTRTICPRVDSISCLVGQNFLGKCVPRTHYPGGHNFLRQDPGQATVAIKDCDGKLV